MPVRLDIQPSSTTTQGVIVQIATPENDGAMSALQAARLAILWGSTPVSVTNVSLIARISPGASSQTVVLRNASARENGVMTAAQAQQLEDLWALSGNSDPVLSPGATLPLSVRFSPDRSVSQSMVLPVASARNVGVMSAKQFQQLTELTSSGDIVLITPLGTDTVTLPGGVNRSNAISMYLPSDAAETELSIGNRVYNAGVGSVLTTDVAMYTDDGSGQGTGAPLAQFNGVVLPANGNMVVVGTVPVIRGSNGKLVTQYLLPELQTAAHQGNVQYGTFANSTSVNPIPPPNGANSDTELYFQYLVSTARNRFGVFGDSNALCYLDAFENAAWNLIAAEKNWAVGIQAVVQQGSYANFANIGGLPFLWQVRFQRNRWVTQLGTNDLSYNDLALMQTNLQAVVALLQSMGVTEIYAWTVPPQAAFPGTDATRTAFNTWLKTNFVALGFTAICDAAAPQSQGGVAQDGDPNALVLAFTTDGTHLNGLGQTQLKNKWLTVLPA